MKISKVLVGMITAGEVACSTIRAESVSEGAIRVSQVTAGVIGPDSLEDGEPGV